MFLSLQILYSHASHVHLIEYLKSQLQRDGPAGSDALVGSDRRIQKPGQIMILYVELLGTLMTDVRVALWRTIHGDFPHYIQTQLLRHNNTAFGKLIVISVHRQLERNSTKYSQPIVYLPPRFNNNQTYTISSSPLDRSLEICGERWRVNHNGFFTGSQSSASSDVQIL